MKKNLQTLMLFTLFFWGAGFAQTVNTGEFIISPGTVVGVVNDFNNTSTGSVYNDGELYIYSNFINDGVVDFLDQGLTRFEGNFIQMITGNMESYFYNVLFNNIGEQPAFGISGDISIANQADFFNGVANNDDYGGQISFEQFATHINTSDVSHVDGPVLKWGNTAFEYPIGDGGFYRYTGISAPENENDVFEGKYFLENSGIQYPHSGKESEITYIDDAEYWTIEGTGASSDILLTLSWDERTTPSELLENLMDIHILRWDEEQQLWVDEGGVPNTSNKVVTSSVSGFGVFTLGLVKTVEMVCDLDIRNALTPNNDGVNDYFSIKVPDSWSCGEVGRMHVEIFNRWGTKVFETDNYDYDGTGNVFRGFSEGRLTVNEEEVLPTGTYFYILDLPYNTDIGEGKMYRKAGYLYISGKE